MSKERIIRDELRERLLRIGFRRNLRDEDGQSRLCAIREGERFPSPDIPPSCSFPLRGTEILFEGGDLDFELAVDRFEKGDARVVVVWYFGGGLAI